jgi:SAM-dependent methyltransferase
MNATPSDRPIGPARRRRIDPVDPYDMFCSSVVLRQLAEWLPIAFAEVLDVSMPLADANGGFDQRIRDVVASAGHRVIAVARDHVGSTSAMAERASPIVVGDPRRLDWIRSASVDVIVAEGGALSYCLAAEDSMREISRVLRPGGRLLASADSLTIGLSRLAEQHRWPELADAPAADVVLVPDPQQVGAFTRCFSPEDLHELFAGAGLEVEWIRSRTVLPASAVRQTLAADPQSLGNLVISELKLTAEHEGEAHGARQVVSARKPV